MTDLEKGTRVHHRSKPSEPFAKAEQTGVVLRTTPAYRHIPAQAHVRWDEEFETWEKLSDLEGI